MSDKINVPTPFLVKILHPSAQVPSKSTQEASGYDLCAVEYHLVDPGTWVAVPTGIAIELTPSYELQIRSRSGLAAKHGVTVLNSPGTIDSDYRGEIKVLLINHGTEPFEIMPGDRIAQAVLGLVWCPESLYLGTPTDQLSDTKRGTGGFGSTGT